MKKLITGNGGNVGGVEREIGHGKRVKKRVMGGRCSRWELEDAASRRLLINGKSLYARNSW